MNEQKYFNITGVVLAAGKGTRMKSDRPKVLHTLLGTPMLWYVLNTMSALVEWQDLWTIIGYKSEEIISEFPDLSDRMVVQPEQLGTGHAIQCCLPNIQRSDSDWCLVVNADAPMLKFPILEEFVNYSINSDISISFLTIELEDPTGYGRIIRNSDGTVNSIVEEKDITDPEIRKINEVNAGVYIFSKQNLYNYLHLLSNENKQQEYYLTELIDISVRNNERVHAFCAGNNPALLGINSPGELIYCEETLKNNRNQDLLNAGVIIRNPSTVRIGPRAKISPNVDITGPVEIYGDSEIDPGTVVESHVVVQGCKVGAGCVLKSFSHLEDAKMDSHCEIGPFARIRPGTTMDQTAKVGNFVEVKKSHLKEGCKANHLSYLGDAEVGEDVNIGAGCITCNFDGKNKHVSVIGNRSFIGSNTSLVAPVTIGEDCLIGAGSTISKDVPENMLSIARTKQKNLNKKML